MLVYSDDKFSKPYKPYLGEDAVYSFINSIIKESKICTSIIEKYFHKELVMIKKDSEDFENFTKCCICDNVYIEGDVKVRDHFHITGRYKRSPQKDCNVNIKS